MSPPRSSSGGPPMVAKIHQNIPLPSLTSALWLIFHEPQQILLDLGSQTPSFNLSTKKSSGPNNLTLRYVIPPSIFFLLANGSLKWAYLTTKSQDIHLIFCFDSVCKGKGRHGGTGKGEKR
ncbi:hypothetical protein COLO4_08848 [Corchorus olitorius]|uniref:Uncharacterized protein n=1 Tax=Corchorus olitorius TaxID=93759 RepID=A0A1R3KEG4_9ROSI|nr:hypothetical protein COLO4_08848 [Corchorus olitorius]